MLTPFKFNLTCFPALLGIILLKYKESVIFYMRNDVIYEMMLFVDYE